MSIVLITEHDENIYNIMGSRPASDVHPPRHKNQYKQDIKRAEKYRQKTAKSMGNEPPKNELAKPTAEAEYNRQAKSAAHKPKPKRVPQPKVCTKDHRLPPLPWHETSKKQVDEKRLAALEGPGITLIKVSGEETGQGLIVRRDMDFIKQNVVVTKKLVPKPYVKKTAGSEPRYVHKKDFGRFPNYLMERTKAKSDMMQSLKDKAMVSSVAKCRYINRDERDQLLLGLKQNWDELQKEFQSLPVLTDTTPKKLRKTNLEAQLKQLEDDIVLIERHPYIYVYDDEKHEAGK